MSLSLSLSVCLVVAMGELGVICRLGVSIGICDCYGRVFVCHGVCLLSRGYHRVRRRRVCVFGMVGGS